MSYQVFTVAEGKRKLTDYKAMTNWNTLCKAKFDVLLSVDFETPCLHEIDIINAHAHDLI